MRPFSLMNFHERYFQNISLTYVLHTYEERARQICCKLTLRFDIF